MYYRGSNAAVIVYDITSFESFLDIKTWIEGECARPLPRDESRRHVELTPLYSTRTVHQN